MSADKRPLKLDPYPLDNAPRDGKALRRHRHLLKQVAQGTLQPALASEVLKREVARMRRLRRRERTALASLVHDLRSPTAAGLQHAALLGERLCQVAPEALPAGCQGSLAAVVRCLRRQLSLIDQLGIYQRLQQKQLLIDPEPVELTTAVCTLLDDLAPLLGEHPVHVQLAVNLPPVEADPGLLDQVLANLLLNAAKYTAAGTPIGLSAQRFDAAVIKLPADVRTVDLSRQWVLLRVWDHGRGIPMQHRRRVFRPFVRLRQNGMLRRDGLGLGLYIARQLCRAHGGEIWIDEGGSGASFSMLWPAAESGAECAAYQRLTDTQEEGSALAESTQPSVREPAVA